MNRIDHGGATLRNSTSGEIISAPRSTIKMEVYEITFDGSVLRRGFWIYVWAVKTPQNGNLIYVGRTGDTSSPFAQSPFRRIGQHVDPNPKSKSNALARHLRKLVI